MREKQKIFNQLIDEVVAMMINNEIDANPEKLDNLLCNIVVMAMWDRSLLSDKDEEDE